MCFPRNIILMVKQKADCLKYNERIRSDEGLTLETSAFESLYGGQFTLLTQLIKPNYLEYSNRRSTTVSLETYPLYNENLFEPFSRHPD